MGKISDVKNKLLDFYASSKLKKLKNKEREKYHKHVLKMEKIRNQEFKECKSDKFLVLEKVNKIYDNHVQAVFDFDLEVQEGEFIVFVGPSGCGKSTTLRMIAGLEEITSGDLYINGDYSNFALPKERGIAMVFQSYALYPHMNVYKNIGFSLKFAKIPYIVTDKEGNPVLDKEGNEVIKYRHYTRNEIREKVLEVAELLELTDYLDRKPKALSGGQCQRVALGRAIIRKPKLFLMDEPLSNLDAKLRASMRTEIVALHKKINATTVYVTHDQTEAMTMADRIVIMKDGYVQQIDTPLEIYNHPANIFVATFIGTPAMNLINTEVVYNKLFFLDSDIALDNFSTKDIKEFYEKELVLLGEQLEAYDARFEERSKLLSKIEELRALEPTEKINSQIQNLLDKVNVLEEKAINRKEILENMARIKEVLATKGERFDVTIGIRPEDVIISDNGAYEGTINAVELLGHDYLVIFNGHNTSITAKAPIIGKDLPKDGTNFKYDLNKSKIYIFDPITKKIIN